METEKHSISTGTYCGHNCVWWRGVHVWGCFSLTCKIDLYVLGGTLTGQKYRDEILHPLVVPHFDCHPLASRPILMDDNARPHRACIAQDYLQQEAIELLPWPAMSPDMNPIEHLWDYLGRKVNARTPKCQNIQELRTALVQERQQSSTQTEMLDSRNEETCSGTVQEARRLYSLLTVLSVINVEN
jgi:transposase